MFNSQKIHPVLLFWDIYKKFSFWWWWWTVVSLLKYLNCSGWFHTFAFYKKAQWSRSFTEYIPPQSKISRFWGWNRSPRQRWVFLLKSLRERSCLCFPHFLPYFFYSFPLNFPLLLSFACKSIIQVELRPLTCPWHPPLGTGNIRSSRPWTSQQ